MLIWFIVDSFKYFKENVNDDTKKMYQQKLFDIKKYNINRS